MAIIYLDKHTKADHPGMIECIEKYYGPIDLLGTTGGNEKYRVRICAFGEDEVINMSFTFNLAEGMKITEVRGQETAISYGFGERPPIM